MRLRSYLMGVVASLAMLSTAHAVPVSGQISLAGYAAAIGSTGMGAATGIDFVSGANGSLNQNVAGGLTSYGGGSGSFAGLACGNLGGGCGSIKDLMTFTGGAVSSFLTLNTGTSAAISFDLSSITSVTRSTASNSLILVANGTINFTGYDSTTGTFTLTAQGDSITSFSATTLAAATTVPEPASLAILGGSMALVGLIRRKKA